MTPVEWTELWMTAERIALWIGLIGVGLIVWAMLDWMGAPDMRWLFSLD